MPKYSARVLIHKDRVIADDFLLELYPAKGQSHAYRRATEAAQKYIRSTYGDDINSYSYSIAYCMRTKLVDAMEKSRYPDAPRLHLDKPAKVVTVKQTTKNGLGKRFATERRGTFNDALSFKPSLTVRIK